MGSQIIRPPGRVFLSSDTVGGMAHKARSKSTKSGKKRKMPYKYKAKGSKAKKGRKY